MTFELFSKNYFKAGIDYHKRLYRVQLKRNGHYRLIHLQTAEILYDDLDPASTVPADFNALQEIVFNISCLCDAPDGEPEPFKYFDLSFDNTFE